MSNDESSDFSYFITGVITAGICLIGSFTVATCNKKIIPNTEEVQSGYVAPGKLEITLEDLDENGEKEVIAEIDGKKYLFKYNEQGHPVFQEYTVEARKVIPQKIIPKNYQGGENKK